LKTKSKDTLLFFKLSTTDLQTFFYPVFFQNESKKSHYFNFFPYICMFFPKSVLFTKQEYKL